MEVLMSRRRVVTYNAAEADQPEAPRRAGLFSSIKSIFVSSTEAHSGAYGRSRGYMIPGGGASHLFESPREWRGSTRQVCGMWPFAAGSSTPFSGAPMGIDIDTNAPVGCDPIAWFVDGIINNPSVFILGLPGYGKSTFVRHMLLGMNGRGIVPLIPGDLKPDYVDEITAMGGQVIQLAPGRGHLNILDPGELSSIADSLPPKTRERLMVDAHSRKLQMLSALISILRKGHITPHEETILDAALTYLEEHHEGVPVVQDLLDVIVARPQALQDVALDRGDEGRYRDATDALVSSLMSLNGQGRLRWTARRCSTLARFLIFTVTCRLLHFWRAGPRRSRRWKLRTRWRMRGWRRVVTISWSSMSFGVRCVRARTWWTVLTR